MDKFLEDIGETGEAAEFSVNPERASKLLTKAWSSRQPRLVYPIHLLASAVGSGATKFEYSRRPSLGTYLKNLFFQDRWEFTVEHDGEPPSAEELRKLQEMLTVNCKPQLRSLALACQIAQTLYKARVSVEACHGNKLDRLLVKNGVWKSSGGIRAARPFTGVRFRVEFCQGSFLRNESAEGWSTDSLPSGFKTASFDADQEYRSLQESGLFAPIEMKGRKHVEPTKRRPQAYWESGATNALYTNLPPRPAPHDFSLLIVVGAHSGGWLFVRHGVLLKSDILETLSGVRLVVSSGSFRTDASGTSLVVEEYVETVMKRCYELLGSLLGELDFEQIADRETIKSLLGENRLYETLPQLYRLPVFEALDGARLDARQARERGQESPDSFSPSEYSSVVKTWAWDSQKYEFGHGFPPISRVWGDGRFLLCQPEYTATRGILDCELREFKEFGLGDHAVVPNTTLLFTCSNIFVQIRDMSGQQEDRCDTVDRGGEPGEFVFDDPVLSATPELGLVLSGGILHKWSLRLREFVKKMELHGDFAHLEHWYESVILLEGEREWGLLDTKTDTWLLREPRVENGFGRTPHLKPDGSMAVEEYPQSSEDGEARLRFYQLEGGRLEPLNTSWDKWASLDVECRGRRLGEALKKVYFRDNGCLWSAEPDSEPKLLARNDGVSDVILHRSYLAWSTDPGCYVLSRDDGRLLFYPDTWTLANCLIKRDSSNKLGIGGTLLNPLTGEEQAGVSFEQAQSRPDHLSLWSDKEGNLVLCDPSTGLALVECTRHLGEYWLNERWIVRLTEQWTVRKADGGEWSRVTLPAAGQNVRVFLWGDFLVFDEFVREEISLLRLPDGRVHRTIQGKLLGLAPDCVSLAYLSKRTIVLYDLDHEVAHEFDRDEDNVMSAEYFLQDVHESARFLDSTRFAHPWVGVAEKKQADWNLIKPHWMVPSGVQVQGEFLCFCSQGQVVFLDFHTASTVATLHADGREWFFFTPLGLYDCSENGEALLRSDVDKKAIQKFRRRGLMNTILWKSTKK